MARRRRTWPALLIAIAVLVGAPGLALAQSHEGTEFRICMPNNLGAVGIGTGRSVVAITAGDEDAFVTVTKGPVPAL